VQEILAREFQGRRITPQNLSQWKRGGYHDWLAHQEHQATLRDFLADAKELGEAASPEKLTEAMFTFATVHYAAAVYDWTIRPENRDKLNLWSPILNDVIRLRNSGLAQQRFELDQERLELRTEVARQRLEIDRAHLDLARQKTIPVGQRARPAEALREGGSRLSPSPATVRKASHLSEVHEEPPPPKVDAHSSQEPPNRGIEFKAANQSTIPKELLPLPKGEGRGEGEPRSMPQRPALNCQNHSTSIIPGREALQIKDLQPNPTKSNNHFFIFPPTTTVDQDRWLRSAGNLFPSTSTHLQAVHNQEESVKRRLRVSEIFTEFSGTAEGRPA
jgi:hypothetical protein